MHTAPIERSVHLSTPSAKSAWLKGWPADWRSRIDTTPTFSLVLVSCVWHSSILAPPTNAICWYELTERGGWSTIYFLNKLVLLSSPRLLLCNGNAKCDTATCPSNTQDLSVVDIVFSSGWKRPARHRVAQMKPMDLLPRRSLRLCRASYQNLSWEVIFCDFLPPFPFSHRALIYLLTSSRQLFRTSVKLQGLGASQEDVLFISSQNGRPTRTFRPGPTEQYAKCASSAGCSCRLQWAESVRSNCDYCDFCVYGASLLLRGYPSMHQDEGI